MVQGLFNDLLWVYDEDKESKYAKGAEKMDEKDFELLRVLEETRNITRAADKLFITQSALSKRIRAMEQELGVEILMRSRQGIRFTPAGETVLAHANEAARQMEQLRRDLCQLDGTIGGSLRAGISINYTLYRLPDVLALFCKKYPKVKLNITTGHSRNLYRQMVEGQLDLAILRGEYPWDGMQFLLSQENICVVCNQEYKGRPLSDYLYISHRTDTTLAAMMTRWMHENGLSGQQNGICVDSITACMEMVRRGLGWGLLPEIALERFGGCITPCTFENGEPFVRRTYILCQRDALKLPQVEAFVEAVKRSR